MNHFVRKSVSKSLYWTQCSITVLHSTQLVTSSYLTNFLSSFLPFIPYIWYAYSVTQSLCDSLLGDVVTVYRDEDSILDQTYQKQICSYFYYDES